MKKPKITVYQRNGEFYYNNDEANKAWGNKESRLGLILHALMFIFWLEKDENGNYTNKNKYDD